jgi:hypothetical protein
MGLAMQALASGDDFDDSVYVYMRTLWISYSLNVDRQYRDLSETADRLQQRVKALKARLYSHAQRSGYITTGGSAPRKKLATKAVRTGRSSDVEDSSDEDEDKKPKKYGWGEDAEELDEVVLFLRRLFTAAAFSSDMTNQRDVMDLIVLLIAEQQKVDK